jgi:multidrug efflux pump subunit AcrB
MSGAAESWLGRSLLWLAGRRVAMAALVVALLVVAVVSLARMPLQLLPEVRYPQLRVISDLPGQTAAVIEESLNQPLEAALVGLPGLVRMESRSGDGRSYIELFFAAGYDLDRALADATQAAQRARAQIPAEFPDPRIFAVSTMQEPALQVAFASDSLGVAELRQRLRAGLLPRLRGVEGVEAVYIGREEVAELVVEVDPERQQLLGVELGAIEEAVLVATEAPVGSGLRTEWFEGMGVMGATHWDPEALMRVPVVGRSGRRVTLGEVVRVLEVPSEERLLARMDGAPAVLVTVHRSARGHSLRVAHEVRRIVDDVVAADVAGDLRATVLSDDSVVAGSAVWSVVVAMVGGSLLAMGLLFFGLRQRRSMGLVGLVVVASMAATVVVLNVAGLSLNLLTLTGLLLSVGLGLDYAIIFFDRLRRRGGGGGDAGARVAAMVGVAPPLLGALLTTLAAVLPFLLVEGVVAMLFRPLIWTVAVSGVFSFLFAVVLLPTFSRGGGVCEGGDEGGEAGWDGRRGLGFPGVVSWVVVVVMAGALWWVGRGLPFEVLPVVDDGFVSVRMTHPAGVPSAELARISGAVEGALRGVEGTVSVFSTVGGYFREGLPSFRPGTSNFQVRVDTRDGGRPSAEWAADARGAVAGLGIAELSLAITLPRIRGVQTRLADADVIVVLAREDGDLLALAGEENRVLEIMEGVAGLVEVERQRSGVSPRLRIYPSERAGEQYGLMPADLRKVVHYGMEGKVLRQRMAGGEPLTLRVRYDRRQAGGPHQLEALRVMGERGPVHLGEVVEFVLVEEPTHIERREGQRVVRLAAELDPAGPGITAVVGELERAMRAAGLPDGVGWWLEGEMEAIELTQKTFLTAAALSLVLVLTLLVVQYGSFWLALSAVVVIPLSALGSMGMLWLMGRPIDAMVLVGLLIAVGIVANNVILVLSEAMAMAGGGEREGFRVALRRAARNRLRPILLTVASTVLGMSPLL